MPTTDIHTLDERAVRLTVDVASKVTKADLDRVTPCSEWTLGELLTHMTVQHEGFAAAAAGNGGDLAVWRMRDVDADPVASYADSAEGVIKAFAVDGVLQGRFTLPEINPNGQVRGAQAIGFHLLDYVVHGWDLARSLDLTFAPDEEALTVAHRIARLIPDDDSRLGSDATFRPARTTPDGASSLDRTLALLGRSPRWPG